MPQTVEEKLGTQNNYDENQNRSSMERKKVYYPNSIGSPYPRSRNQYEFVFMGLQDKEQEVFARITKILEERKIRVLSLSFFNDQTPAQYVMDIVCDFAKAKCTPADLALRLNKEKKYVKRGEMGDLNQTIFSSFLFPLTFFGTVRALAIDSDRFTRLLTHVREQLGDNRAKKVLYEDGREEGREIVSAIKEFFPNDDSDESSRSKNNPDGDEDNLLELGNIKKEDYILQNAKAFLRSAGWGTLSFSKMKEPGVYCATIWDPPTDADGGIVLNNYFLQGMIAGVIENFLQENNNEAQVIDAKSLSIMKESYDEESRALSLYYVSGKSVNYEEEEHEQTANEASSFLSVVPQQTGLGTQVQQIIPTDQPQSEIEKQIDILIRKAESQEGNQVPSLPTIESEKPEDIQTADVQSKVSAATRIVRKSRKKSSGRRNSFRKNSAPLQSNSPSEGRTDEMGTQEEDAFWL